MTFPRSPEPAATPAVRATALIAAATADPGLRGVSARLQQLCRAAVIGLGLEGAVVHVMTESGASGIGASSSPRATSLAELVVSVGEGPAVDAFSSRRPVLVPDLMASAARWPGYVEAGAGLGAVWSWPLHLGAVVVGVLDLYDGRARSLTEPELGLAVHLSRLALDLLLDGRGELVGGLAGGLAVGLAAVEHHAEVHQAQGMVMVDLGVDLAEALVLMRAHAFANDFSLLQLAQAIINGAAIPRAWGD